jgi:hypothetical protein
MTSSQGQNLKNKRCSIRVTELLRYKRILLTAIPLDGACRGKVVPASEGVSPSMQQCSLVRCVTEKMVEIPEFFRRETAFTPETIQILAAALDEAWERLRQSGSRLVRPAYSRAMRKVVAKRIIEMAQRGVQERETLVEDAMHFVTTNYERPSNGV